MRDFITDVDGARLSGETSEAPAVVLVHGMAGDRYDWNMLVDTLPDSLALLRYDLRGFGASTATDGVTFSHSDDLIAVLDAQGIDRAVLVGVSMGGAIVANTALNHPDRVSGLVLISPGLIGWRWSRDWRTRWRDVAALVRAGDIDAARSLWWAHPMFDAVRETSGAGDLREALDRYHGRQWLGDDQRPELPDIERLHTLRTPTVLLSGGRDVEDMRLIADTISAAAPNVERIDLPDAGHMLHRERPADVAAAITRLTRPILRRS
ncbi:alpha/beta fold hydrolase [Gordonia pseudamarae]|jgi:pimeloyl-ACP methyl ester carboxylesterase|uniref:Alpha/beta fold hydrolase n=1 Tax=Gordonia pseudamarae TaxID=2831662 RepID=A0ABX6IKH3_9ACTN|nr:MULTISPECIES: alpha/beta fold hydrolase [Gordonia]MBD0023884.1 alpha/beta fold hydrolase [Gordonia sp. (in: high G+C Gram-positive bacteria)]QHN26960.1 alpha/beta fold hydrolase [Gordonia pseudamarae]QHN35849.1 alpha/beta fold hydrolase [Gordonia pseudamarae]